MKHFQPDEFACKCGCGKGYAQMEPEFLDKLDRAREYASTPFTLTSAFRCINHNITAGGKPDSAHRFGWGVDIKCIDSRFRFLIVNGLIRAGFDRIGIAPTFIHADCDPNKPEWVLWTYYK
jgi:hypothetical protein